MVQIKEGTTRLSAASIATSLATTSRVTCSSSWGTFRSGMWSGTCGASAALGGSSMWISCCLAPRNACRYA